MLTFYQFTTTNFLTENKITVLAENLITTTLYTII